MTQAQNVRESSRSTSTAPLRRRAVARVITAGAIVAGTLAVAAPSWAGPLTGC